MVILHALTLKSAPLLLAYVPSIDWLAVDCATRLSVLHETHPAIIRLRERHGLGPFDDGPPDERENVFRTIRSIVIP
jgi:hypothetical protein